MHYESDGFMICRKFHGSPKSNCTLGVIEYVNMGSLRDVGNANDGFASVTLLLATCAHLNVSSL